MGIKTETLEELFAAQPDASVIHPIFDWGAQTVSWQLTWREPIDRGTPRTRTVAWLLREVANIPSPAWYHDQGIFKTRQKADDAAASIIHAKGGRCAVYEKPVDVLLPLTPIHPLTLHAEGAQDEMLAKSFDLVERGRLTKLRDHFNEVFTKSA